MTCNPYHTISEVLDRIGGRHRPGDVRTGGSVIHNTYYTLSEAFDLIGQHLHGDAWTGGEADVLFCQLNEDDIAVHSARKEKAVEPSHFPGGSGSDGAPEQLMSLFAHARDEQTEPINIIRLEVAAELLAKMGPEGGNYLLFVDHTAEFRLGDLLRDAQFESLKRLRSGNTLSGAHFAILDELEKEFHAKERREKVVFWITSHAWSGGGSDAMLAGYIFTSDDGKITPILAHCWDAQSFRLSLYDSKATMDDQPWPADGVLVFLKSELDAILDKKESSVDDATARDDQLQRAAEPPNKRPRNCNVETEALLKNRIEAVLAKAKAKWPNPQKRPGVNQMAQALTVGQPKGKAEGFGQEAIRKILAGIYKPAKDRSIPGLSSR